MGLIRITNIVVKNAEAPFQAPFELNVQFEVLQDNLKQDLKWEAVYVGRAEDNKYDQVLDSFIMQDLTYGSFQFDWEVRAPDHLKIPSKYDLLDSSIIIIYVYYDNKKFFKCCYVLGNRYTDPELIEADPEEVQIDKVIRYVRVSDPKVTELQLDWNAYENRKESQAETSQFQEINLFE
jgi:ASF1 like histone chaperone